MAATSSEMPSSRPGGMSGSSGFSAAGCPATISARASASQRCSVISAVTCATPSFRTASTRPLCTMPISSLCAVPARSVANSYARDVPREGSRPLTVRSGGDMPPFHAVALGPLLGIEAVRGHWRKGNKLPSAQALPKDRSHWRLLTRKWMRFPDRGNFLTYRPLVSSTRVRIGGAQLPVDVLRPATAALPAMSEREPIEPLTVAEFRIIAVSHDSMLRRGDRKESCFAAGNGAALIGLFPGIIFLIACPAVRLHWTGADIAWRFLACGRRSFRLRLRPLVA